MFQNSQQVDNNCRNLEKTKSSESVIIRDQNKLMLTNLRF